MKKDIKTYKPKTPKRILLPLLFLMTILCLSAVYGVYTFVNTYGFQTPIILRSPVYKLHPEILLSPIGSKSATIEGTFDVGKIADYIYMKESSSGKADGCRDLGLYNGYGYRQNSFEWICYSSHEEVRQHVINWLTQNIKDGNIEQALCRYNQGIDTQSCSYAINYK